MVAQRDGKDRLDQLPRQAYLAGWPTPVANDDNKTPEAHLAMKKRMGERDGTGANRTAITSLQVLVKYLERDQPARLTASGELLTGWPTPTVQSPNSQRGNGQDPEKRKAGGHSVNLNDAVRYLDHPQPARLTVTGDMLTGSYAGMESGGQLNPAHSRWLMGLPPVWDHAAPIGKPPPAPKAKATASDD